MLKFTRRNAGGTKSGDDNVVRTPCQRGSISTPTGKTPTSYTNYFDSYDALLNSTLEPKSSFPSSKSVSNISDHLAVEKGSLTDVHSGDIDDIVGHFEDEVEIISLLEEQIPKYKLRADSITKFGGKIFFYILIRIELYKVFPLFCTGYSNEDFIGIPYPALQDFSPITPEQAYLTLGYFCK